MHHRLDDARVGRMVTRARYMLLPEGDIEALLAALEGGPRAPVVEALARALEGSGRLVGAMLAAGWCGDPLDAADRVLVALAASHPSLLRAFLARVAPESPGWPGLVDALDAAGLSTAAVVSELLALSAEWVDRGGVMTPLGLAVLARVEASPGALVEALAARAPSGGGGGLEGSAEVRWAEAVGLCMAAEPPRWEAAEALVAVAPEGQRGRLAATLLERDPERFVDLARALGSGAPCDDRDAALVALVAVAPTRCIDLAEAVAEEPLRPTPGGVLPVQAAAVSMLAARDPARWSARLLSLVEAVPGPWALEALAALPPERARPGLVWMHQHAGGHLAVQALTRLLASPWEGRGEAAVRAVASEDKAVRAAGVEAGMAFPAEARGVFVNLLDDPRVEVRLEAARLVAGVDDPGVRDAVVRQHARERSARVRAALAVALGRIEPEATPRVRDVITEADDSPDDVARRAMVSALDAAAKGRPRGMLAWYAAGRLPGLRWVDGTAAPASAGLSLARWQVEHGQIDPAPAVMELVSALDAASARQWASAMLDAWMAAGAPARDYGCLALAVALAQDGVVDTLAAQVPVWYRASRGALGAEALQLLAALGSDRALRALDLLRTEHPFERYGLHARQLLEAEARARGEALETLLDRAVPRFGLDPDGTRTLDNGARRYTVVLEGWSPVLVDAIGRRHTTYTRPSRPRDPQRAAAAWEAWRALHDALGPVARRETARLEEALRGGRVWTAAAWSADVARHPVLRRLAAGLVWTRDDGGYFVADAEGLLRDAAGTAHAPVGTLRIAHPVEMESAVRVRWRTVLAARSERSPVRQMERAVYLRTEADAGRGRYEGFSGRALLAVSDKGHRVVQPWQAAGWFPGTTEGGLCHAFSRRFEAAGVDAVLEVEGLALWAEHARQSAVTGVRFRRSDGGEALRLGEVPLRVYAEALADVARMLEG